MLQHGYKKLYPAALLLLLCGWLVVLFISAPYQLYGDGLLRYRALDSFLTGRPVAFTPYSLVGPLFSLPLLVLGRTLADGAFWVSRYNFLLFCLMLFGLWYLLKDHTDSGLLSRFLLLLSTASLFPHHLLQYYGEMFTAVTATLGLLLLIIRRSSLGWLLLIVSGINSPVLLVPLLVISVLQSREEQRWRHLIIPLLAVTGYFVEWWVRTGNPLAASVWYAQDRGFPTILPYSGKPGFSYPFFLGVLSIALAPGKGLLFFAPGLLFSVPESAGRVLRRLWGLLVAVLAVLIVSYSRWWAWYGGWFWGPRFFLIAGVPASLALAAGLSRKSESVGRNLALLAAVVLSWWVGTAGIVFGQDSLSPLCRSENYALEHLCWYVPEFSPLWLPFRSTLSLPLSSVIQLLYALVILFALCLPLAVQIIRSSAVMAGTFARQFGNMGRWRW